MLLAGPTDITVGVTAIETRVATGLRLRAATTGMDTGLSPAVLRHTIEAPRRTAREGMGPLTDAGLLSIGRMAFLPMVAAQSLSVAILDTGTAMVTMAMAVTATTVTRPRIVVEASVIGTQAAKVRTTPSTRAEMAGAMAPAVSTRRTCNKKSSHAMRTHVN